MDNAESMAGMSSVEYYASLEDDFYSDRIGNGYYDGYDYSDFESERNHSERSPKEGAAFAEKVAYEEMLSRQFSPMGSTDGVYHDGATGIVGGAGKTGTLVIEAGCKFSASEIRAAEYMKSLGNDVTLRMPQGTRAGGGTSDLLVNGVKYDVYTPITAKPENIISAIAKKNSQTTGVVLDLFRTSVTAEQLGNILIE